jgi:phosphate/sulfate permease
MDRSVFLTILILAIVIFGIFSMVFKNRKGRFFKSILLAVFVAPVIYFLLVFILILSTTGERSRDFDSVTWQANSKTESGTDNYEMVDDLINSRLLIDKDSLEVKEILGSPELKDKEQKFWQYYAGTSTGFGFTDHQLVVKFANNKVIMLEHIRQQD